MKTYKRLTYRLLRKYGHRKKIGRLCFLIDPINEISYVVPKNTEHIDYAKKILKTDKLKRYPFPLVPSRIHFKGEKGLEKVVGIITGESGLEQRFGKIHTYSSLKKAHEIACNLVISGDVPIETIENKIIFKYARN